MANKRMLDKSIVCSDAFIELNPFTQCLYIQMNMNSDDDGFVNNVISLSRMVGCRKENIQELVDSKFILDMGKGIYVIKHWLINNTIRKDRYSPTKYQDLYKLLYITEDKKYRFIADQNSEDDDSIIVEEDDSYYEEVETDNGFTTGIPNGNQTATQSSIEKDSIDKDSVETNTMISLDISNTKSAEIENRNECVLHPGDSSFREQNEIRNHYSEEVYKVLRDAGLPCSKSSLMFQMQHFYQALPIIHELRLHSDDVIQAVKNYAAVCNMPDTWWTSRQDFYHFCSSKTILKFVPDTFDIKQYENKSNTPKRGSAIHQLGLDRGEGEIPF